MKTVSNRPAGRQALISLTGISKTYKNAAGSFAALNDINLDFFTGEFVGVIGKSGSGKSTLVNMITGIDRPSTGTVLVGEKDIHAMKESKQARWRGLNMGVVFQFFQLLPMLTLVENVLLPMDFCEKYDHDKRYDRAMDLLALVGLEDVAHKLPGSVSGGQQQSAAIARALANDPPIIVADEPTGNLDVRTADSVYKNFEALAGEGRTIIMITHDPEIEERLSRKVIISDGEVIDPLLVHTLPWLPHTSLRTLTHGLERRVLRPGDVLDITGELGNRLIMIEHGAVQLMPIDGTQSGQSATLSGGGFLLGAGVIEGEAARPLYQAKIMEPTVVALIARDVLAPELNAAPDGVNQLVDAFLKQIQGKAAPNPDEKGANQ